MRIWILILGSKGVKQNVLGRLSKVTLLCQLKIIVYTITQVFFLLHFCIPPNKFPRKGYVWSRYCLSKKPWDWFSTGRFANRQYPALLGLYEFKNFNQTPTHLSFDQRMRSLSRCLLGTSSFTSIQNDQRIVTESKRVLTKSYQVFVSPHATHEIEVDSYRSFLSVSRAKHMPVRSLDHHGGQTRILRT